MRVTFLGTGTSQGIPVIGCHCEVCESIDFQDNRLRTSVYIEVDNVCLNIDTGPDFRQQMLRERIEKLDAVLYTHEHKDHTAGMDELRSFNFLQKKDMPVYGRKSVLAQLKQEFAYAFSDKKYPGVPEISLNEIENKPFWIEGVEIIPIEVLHYKLPVFGFRIKDFCYITDANFISEEECEKIKGAKVLVINALHKETHLSHFNLQQAIELATKLEVPEVYLIHIGHRMGLHRKVSLELPSHIQFAYDGLKLNIQ